MINYFVAYASNTKPTNIDIWFVYKSRNQPTVPQKDEIIGYITSGQYSFARGQGFGIGCCTLSGLLEVFKVQLK